MYCTTNFKISFGHSGNWVGAERQGMLATYNVFANLLYWETTKWEDLEEISYYMVPSPHFTLFCLDPLIYYGVPPGNFVCPIYQFIPHLSVVVFAKSEIHTFSRKRTMPVNAAKTTTLLSNHIIWVLWRLMNFNCYTS